MWRKEQRPTQGGGIRNKDMRLVNPCGMKLKMTKYYISPYTDQISFYTIERQGDCQAHNHTLDFMDSDKSNQRIRAVAGAEVANGYTVSVVAKNLQSRHREDGEAALLAAGGRYLTRKDVSNASSNWRRPNPNVRMISNMRYSPEEQ